jgi:hypothetical protein
MLITLSVTYLIVSLVAAIVFYCACAAGARAERAEQEEIHLDQSDLDFHFNHLEWAEKANG